MKTNQEYASMINALEPCKAIVLNVQEMKQHAVLVIFDYSGGVDGTTAAVIYEDGSIFTLWDWQSGEYPQNEEEVSFFDWRVGVSDQKALVLCGQPRQLL